MMSGGRRGRGCEWSWTLWCLGWGHLESQRGTHPEDVIDAMGCFVANQCSNRQQSTAFTKRILQSEQQEKILCKLELSRADVICYAPL